MVYRTPFQQQFQQLSGVRSNPPLVGIQLSATPCDNNTTDSDNSNTDTDNDATYDPSIMHRVVPKTLQHATVKMNATALDIASKFSIPASHISSHWVLSNTSSSLPQQQRRPQQQYNHLNERARRRMPIIPSAEITAHKQLANALRRSLSALLSQQLKEEHKQQQEQQEQQEQEQEQQQQQKVILPNSCLSTSTASSTSSVRHNRRQVVHQKQTQTQTSLVLPLNTSCGFATTATHADLLLNDMENNTKCDNINHNKRRVVSKKVKSLYRIARTSCYAMNYGLYYTELKINETNGEGGICIGLLPNNNNLSLNKVIGSDDLQVGYHSAGKIIINNRWNNASLEYGKNDTISVILHIYNPQQQQQQQDDSNSSSSSPDSLISDDDECHDAHNTHKFKVWFFVNGQLATSYNEGILLHNSTNNNVGFHVAVSLYRLGSQVSLNCCHNDWSYFDQSIQNIKHIQHQSTKFNSFCQCAPSSCSSYNGNNKNNNAISSSLSSTVHNNNTFHNKENNDVQQHSVLHPLTSVIST